MQKWEKRFAFYVFGLIGLAMFCGCSAGRATISFSNDRYNEPKVSGTVKVKFSKVQEFRSLLESLQYRETEKPK